MPEKSTISIGRNPEFNDIFVDDILMSRKHAIFQHKNDGTFYVFDNSNLLELTKDSSHGTFVNKKQIKPGEFVQLKDGDFLKFGPKETRYFIVKLQDVTKLDAEAAEGEEKAGAKTDLEAYNEFNAHEEGYVNKEKQSLEDYLKKQKNRSHRELYEELLLKEKTPKQLKAEAEKPRYDRSEVTWGMVDEEIVYAEKGHDDEIVRTDLLRMLPNLSGKQISKIEEFEKKQNKMKMLVRDYNKIVELETNGSKLEEDQREVKKEIDERMNKLATELSMAEDKLKQMFGLEEKHHLRRLELTMQASRSTCKRKRRKMMSTTTVPWNASMSKMNQRQQHFVTKASSIPTSN